ncbi:MAG: hypothetical protein AAF388_01885 [Bacteroidota bacterium]
MSDFRSLIKNGDLKKAINQLELLASGRDLDTLLLLTSRVNALYRDNSQGKISAEDYTIEHNKLVGSILSVSKNILPVVAQGSHTIVVNTVSPTTVNLASIKSDMAAIVSKYKRREPSLSQAAKAVIEQIGKYETDSLTSGLTFDAETAKNKISADAIQVDGAVKRFEKERKLSVFQQVETLLDKLSYANIQQAYDLAVMEGFRSDTIAEMLPRAKENERVWPTIADSIEQYFSRITQVK